MGEYRDGKWYPTWGDDQFGVVDTLPQMYDRVRNIEKENHRLQSELETARAEIERLRSTSIYVCPHGYPQTVRCSRCGE